MQFEQIKKNRNYLYRTIHAKSHIKFSAQNTKDALNEFQNLG